MIFELPQSDYNKIYPLVDGRKETKVLLLSVLSKNSPGKVFTDNLKDPKTALVWVIGNAFYFLGDSSNTNFIDSLNEFIDTTIAPQSIDLVGPDSYFETLIYDKDWQQKLNKVFQKRDLTKYGFDNCDYMFTFNRDSYFSTKERKITLPDGYVIEKISKDIITGNTGQTLREDILDFWGSINTFFEKGFGYCLIKKGQIIAPCFTAYVHEHYHEIAIRTYIKEERRKGFATVVARAYLDKCIENGLIPAWSTQHTNTASHALAEKLGFELHSKLPSIMFSFN